MERDSDGFTGWMDLSKVNDLALVPDDVEMIIMFNSEAVTRAKQKEVDKWKRHKVYEEVEDNGQDTMSAR